MLPLRALIAIVLTILLGTAACTTAHPLTAYSISSPYILEDALIEAPYGGQVSADIINYTRAAPYVGIAGKLQGDGVAEAQRLGFKLIIDLRAPQEDGVTEEIAEAARLGIAYQNIPLAKDGTAWDQVTDITAALSQRSNYPVLVHCASANRAGAVWALYRANQGVPALIAIEEGRAAGLTSREAQVREVLELDPL